jgi:adenylate cyclase class 2
MHDTEIEIKFYINNLPGVQARLEHLGAQLVQPRTHEVNLRFDTPGRTLSRAFQVLRLRQDTAARMTFKGPSRDQDGVRVRTELEFVVDDFETAKAFLEALGYQVILLYEKYRTVFDIEGVHVTLDEMPYGSFVELEGPNAKALQSVNSKLGLRWSTGVPASYTVLFDQLCQRLKLEFRDLSFENFTGLHVGPQDLGVEPADLE